MKKFSDFAEITTLEGDKMKIDNILNQNIVVIGARISKSKYSKNESGKYLTLQFKMLDEEKPYVIFTGSEVLISQIEKYKEQMPFEAKIVKINRYYTFS